MFLGVAGVANGRVVESWGGLRDIKDNPVSPNMHCLELEFLLANLSFLPLPESPLLITAFSSFLILLKQSFSASWVAGWLNQHRKSSSTFIFSTGCRTFAGDIFYQFPFLLDQIQNKSLTIIYLFHLTFSVSQTSGFLLRKILLFNVTVLTMYWYLFPQHTNRCCDIHATTTTFWKCKPLICQSKTKRIVSLKSYCANDVDCREKNCTQALSKRNI